MSTRGTLRAALIALVALATVGCGTDASTGATQAATTTPAATAGGGAPTAVLHVTPVSANGRLSTGFSVSARRSGSCLPGSAAIGAAYRCSSKSTILDPCFPGRDARDRSRVYCLAAPYAHQVVALSVRRIPKLPKGTKLERKTPWGIQLADGTRCLVVQGAADMVDGKPVGWTCGRTRVLARDLKRGRRWSVSAYAYRTDTPSYPRQYRPLGRRAIARVWFGTAARTP
jgi:hypothetical protein